MESNNKVDKVEKLKQILNKLKLEQIEKNSKKRRTILIKIPIKKKNNKTRSSFNADSMNTENHILIKENYQIDEIPENKIINTNNSNLNEKKNEMQNSTFKIISKKPPLYRKTKLQKKSQEETRETKI